MEYQGSLSGIFECLQCLQSFKLNYKGRDKATRLTLILASSFKPQIWVNLHAEAIATCPVSHDYPWKDNDIEYLSKLQVRH